MSATPQKFTNDVFTQEFTNDVFTLLDAKLTQIFAQADEGFKIQAVTENPYAIRYIANPSDAVKIAAFCQLKKVTPPGTTAEDCHVAQC
jgi:hypothetical protein